MALMVVGAGAGVINSLSNLVSSAVDGLVSFFGGELPLDKIRNFANTNLGNSAQVYANVEVISGWSKGMKLISEATGGGGFFSTLGKLGSALIEGIIGFFQEDIPYDKIKRFGTETLGDPKQMQQNLTAIQYYFSGLSLIKDLTQKGMLEAIGDLFTFEINIPTDKIKEFSNLATSDIDVTNLNTSKDIVNAYVSALKSLDKIPSRDFGNIVFGDVKFDAEQVQKIKDFANGGPNVEL